MNQPLFLLGGALLCALPVAAQTHDHHVGAPGMAMPQHATAPTVALPNPRFAAAQKTWADVRAQTAELDGLLAARNFGEMHDAALGLRDTLRELRFGWDNLAPAQKTIADKNIRQVDAILDALHESADHNDGAGVARQARLLHVTLDQVAAVFPAQTLASVGPIAATTAVKDPFCRMTVDPATAAAKVSYGGQFYYFCAKPEAQAFAKNPAPYVKLYDELAFGTPKKFGVSVVSGGKVVANQAANLTFAVREDGQTALTTQFQPLHEKLMHLILVSDDLSWFAHEHPVLGKDGRFTIAQKFPRDGRYFLYSDFTPRNGTNVVATSEVRVGVGITRAPVALVPDKTLSKTVDGVRVDLKLSAPLRAGKQTLLTYTLSKNGAPVTNMTPYLAAMGHMMAVAQGGQSVVHTHAVGSGNDPVSGLDVTDKMATVSGPTQTFKLEVPTSGLYKIWAQFGVEGQIVTVPFAFDVLPDKATATPVNAQKITLNLPLDYKAEAATVKAGVPVALTFKLTSDAGCGNTISLPAAGWTKTLKVGESATVVYTPTKSGPLVFQCGMGHMKGSLLAK